MDTVIGKECTRTGSLYPRIFPRLLASSSLPSEFPLPETYGFPSTLRSLRPFYTSCRNLLASSFLYRMLFTGTIFRLLSRRLGDFNES
jgi:hypothetical protein